MPDGPSIPNELLDARDNGEVVFLCGAGVSVPAGLDNFEGLARKVVKELGVAPDTEVSRLMEQAFDSENTDFKPPMDQVFGILQREYGVVAVEKAVCKKLVTPRNVRLTHHETILRLSTDSHGTLRLVTTNFDVLFEKVEKSLKRHVAPVLPDLSHGNTLEGIVYLHGRRQRQPATASDPLGLIIGSADFGRAYLADAWATKFMQSLLTRYTVVLLGYSADDPPVRYLLEGLKSRSGEKTKPIYAFCPENNGALNANWNDRGVIPITYPNSTGDHAALWESLNAWADRADDPPKWRQQTLDLARKSPSKLAPFERGQVASIVSTAQGAKEFLEIKPAPISEWLCVFDASIRYAEPERNSQTITFDPLLAFGLDDDPPRRPNGARGGTAAGADILAPLSSDENPLGPVRLSGYSSDRPAPLPSRLFYLARWIAEVSTEITTLWWTIKKIDLHGRLQELIEWTIEREEAPHEESLKRLWRLTNEALEATREYDRRDLYSLKRRTKGGEWSKADIRDLERILTPHLKVTIPFTYRSRPPQDNSDDSSLESFPKFEVSFNDADFAGLSIPNSALPQIMAVARRCLERAENLLDDLGVKYWELPSLHPEEPDGSSHHDDAKNAFVWFAQLFARLAESNPELAKQEIACWPISEPFFFDRLRVFSWEKKDAVSASEVATQLAVLSDSALWNGYNQRDILWSLRERWAELDSVERKVVEDRIRKGDEKWDSEDEAKHRIRINREAAVWLGWLQANGCELSEEAENSLPSMRAADPSWNDAWTGNADYGFESRGGWVKVDTDTSTLGEVKIGDLLARASEHSKHDYDALTEFKPFLGVIKTSPARALSALSYEARHSRFPINFWQDLLSEWPDDASPRANCLLAHRIASLPGETLLELRYYYPSWLDKNLPSIVIDQGKDLWQIWDPPFEVYESASPDAAKSSIGETYFGGVSQERSRKTYDHAINSPVGVLTGCLLKCLNNLKLAKDSGIPKAFAQRLERVQQIAGEGGDHAVAVLCRDIHWLHYLDPGWTENRLVARLDQAHDQCEAAWSGFLISNQMPSSDLFRVMKPHFLAAFQRASEWTWEDRASRKLSEFLVLATIAPDKEFRYLSLEEARSALRHTDESGRSSALWMLNEVMEESGGWTKGGKLFFERVWPKEVRFQTGSTSEQISRLIMEADDDFPFAVSLCLPYLRPQENPDLFRLTNRDEQDETNLPPSRFPYETLLLVHSIVGDHLHQIPYGMEKVLNSIATADPTLRLDPMWQRLNSLLL